MSRIDDLLAQYCPDGVEYRQLDYVADIKNGSDYKHLSEGSIPVYGSGGVMDVRVSSFAYDKPTVLLPRKGSITNVFYVDEPFWNIDTVFYTIIDTNKIIPRYFYHVMLNARIEKYSTGSAARPSLTQTALKKIKIPVPPLQVQEEIVRILDSFTQLEAELEAELEARRKQYEYYRDSLLDINNPHNPLADMLTQYCPDGVEYKLLGNVLINFDSKRKPVTKKDRREGIFPYYGANGIQDYVDDYIFDGTYLLIGEDGSVIKEDKTPVINWASGKIWVNNHAHVLQCSSEDALLRYVYFYLQAVDITKYITGGTQPKLNQKNLNKIPIAVPALQVQERIVEILDKFDALVNDLSSGLPAEIQARRQQYEHYRDQLLSFSAAK